MLIYASVDCNLGVRYSVNDTKSIFRRMRAIHKPFNEYGKWRSADEIVHLSVMLWLPRPKVPFRRNKWLHVLYSNKTWSFLASWCVILMPVGMYDN